MSKMLDFNHPYYCHNITMPLTSLYMMIKNHIECNRDVSRVMCKAGTITGNEDNTLISPNLIEQVYGLGFFKNSNTSCYRTGLDLKSIKNFCNSRRFKLNSFRAYNTDGVTTTRLMLNLLDKDNNVLPDVFISINNYRYSGGYNTYTDITFDTITARGKIKTTNICRKTRYSRDSFHYLSYGNGLYGIKNCLSEAFPAKYANGDFSNF